ncbi:MAG: hypothetical protein HQ500_08675 [Flavobacteriales bacterium]|nr:hypothetical protein [Flavobacteriales bacterium]
MRRVTFIQSDRQGVFDIIRQVVEEHGFDVLYADRYHLEVEAMKVGRLGRKKHMSVRIIEFKNNELEVNIEVRNMGLEIKRNKRNDLLEAKIERALNLLILKDRKNFSAA